MMNFRISRPPQDLGGCLIRQKGICVNLVRRVAYMLVSTTLSAMRVLKKPLTPKNMGNLMNRVPKWIVLMIAFFLLTNGPSPYDVLADRDEHEEKRWHQKIFDWDDDDDDDHHSERKDSKHHNEDYLNPVDNTAYKEECGVCHFPYQPGLLSADSWEKILAGPEDHFGEVLEIDPESKKVIAEYLKANAAEHSSAKRAVKIMRSLGSRTPLRITEIPYIQQKHHEVSADVLKRKSIGSLSNCSACHTTAEKGIYDDDNVVIPK